MKRSFLLLALLFFSLAIFSQVRIGPKAGFNMSMTTQVEDELQTGYTPGYQFGLSMMFGDKVFFQPEILYTQKGVLLEASDNSIKYANRYDYWQVPLMLNFGAGNDTYRIFTNFGPYISYWKSGRIKTTANGHTDIADYQFDDDWEDGLKDHRWDYGFSGGGGAGVRLGKGWLMLEARYDYGFDDIRTVKNTSLFYQSIRNRTISGTISYLWQF